MSEAPMAAGNDESDWMLLLVFIVSGLTEVTAYLNEDLPAQCTCWDWQQYLTTHPADIQRTAYSVQCNGIVLLNRMVFGP